MRAPAIVAGLALAALATGLPQRLAHAPELDVPVTVPDAAHAEEVPAWRFVGPLDVEGLAPADLCGATDRAALLRAGRFGWRVLVADADWTEPAARWAQADLVVTDLCGVAPETDVLVAIDGATEDVARRLGWIPSRRLRLLVGHEGGPLSVHDVVRTLPAPAVGPRAMLLQVIGPAGDPR
jgi:hypothetical protein